MTGLVKNPPRFYDSFARAERGGVAIYVALVSAIMIGFGALVVDLGRLFTLQTELQNAADASALAGAVELDGTATAITRARLAARNALIGNRQTFASGGANVVILDDDIRFLSALPTSDEDPITSAHLTTDPISARFIEVTATAREVDYLLAPVLAARVGGDGNAPQSGQASALAIAGYNSVVCNFPPLMICNPSEANGNVGAPFTAVPGQLVQLKTSGGDGQWAPGNFGLLDPPQGNQGAAAVVENLASSSPTGCFTTSVDLRTGSVSNPISKGLNVRFDMYENPGFGGNQKSEPQFKPASNVIKGKYRSGSNFVDYSGATPNGRGMPRHACFVAGDCSTVAASENWPNERFQPPADSNLGAQQAFWSDYWATNHPGQNFSTEYATIDSDGDGVITRLEMYNWENGAGGIPVGDVDGDGTPGEDPDDSTANSSASGENGNPTHYNGSEQPDAARRLMPVAVLNCIANGPLNGNTNGVPVTAFAKMFLTHAAEDGAEQTIYAEVVGVLQPGVDDDVLHDIIHLYR